MKKGSGRVRHTSWYVKLQSLSKTYACVYTEGHRRVNIYIYINIQNQSILPWKRTRSLRRRRRSTRYINMASIYLSIYLTI